MHSFIIIPYYQRGLSSLDILKIQNSMWAYSTECTMFALPPLVSLLPRNLLLCRSLHWSKVSLVSFAPRNTLHIQIEQFLESFSKPFNQELNSLCAEGFNAISLCARFTMHTSHSLICLVSFRLRHINMTQTNRLILFPGTEWHQ